MKANHLTCTHIDTTRSSYVFNSQEGWVSWWDTQKPSSISIERWKTPDIILKPLFLFSFLSPLCLCILFCVSWSCVVLDPPAGHRIARFLFVTVNSSFLLPFVVLSPLWSYCVVLIVSVCWPIIGGLIVPANSFLVPSGFSLRLERFFSCFLLSSIPLCYLCFVFNHLPCFFPLLCGCVHMYNGWSW